jgi:uncharacterized membrane protein
MLILALGGTGFIKAAECRPASGPFLDAKLTVIPLDNAQAHAVSPNGKWVAGSVRHSAPFVWSQETGVQRVTDFPANESNSISCVLDDGTILGSYSGPDDPPGFYHGYLWTPNKGLRWLISKINGQTVVFNPIDATPDGKIIAGSAFMGNEAQQAAVMDHLGHIRFLQLPDGSVNSVASNISSDGKIIIGGAAVKYDTLSLRWVNEKLTPVMVDGKPKDWATTFLSLSEDGRTIVESEWSNLNIIRDGKLINIYTPEPQKATLSSDTSNSFGTPNLVIPTAFMVTGTISKDGLCLLCSVPNAKHPSADIEPCIWTERDGLRFIPQMLRDAHIDIPDGFRFNRMQALSRDGRVLVGSLIKGNQFKAIVLNTK